MNNTLLYSIYLYLLSSFHPVSLTVFLFLALKGTCTSDSWTVEGINVTLLASFRIQHETCTESLQQDN